MTRRTLKSDSLLLLVAIIWGFAFVAQRSGMEFIGPFTFNGIRFALGSISLLPLIYFRRKKVSRGIDHTSGNELNLSLTENKLSKPVQPLQGKTVIFWGLFAGILLFMGASLQQAGIVYTTAGKAGFITGLYVVLVPILGIFWGHRTGMFSWFAAGIAAVGLYFLSINETLTLSWGDLLEILGTFFWAGHVLLISWLSPRMDSFKLSSIQFAGCSFLSLIAAFMFETIRISGITAALIPLLYGGLISAGIAYTLQVVAQKDAPASHASIILSLEAVFAAIGGGIILGETLSLRAIFGCSLMLAGIILSQAQFFFKKK